MTAAILVGLSILAVGAMLYVLATKGDPFEYEERDVTQTADTTYRMSMDDALALYFGAGFESVYGETFKNTNNEREVYGLLWHPEGILAVVESYGVTTVNSHGVYYNLRVDPDFDGAIWGSARSGHFHTESYDLGERIWVGNSLSAEGVLRHLDSLREIGEFLPEWVESPVMSLANYMDWQRWRNLDWATREAKAIEKTESVISRLPLHVQTSLRRSRRFNNNESE